MFGIVFGLVFGCLPNKDLYVLVYIVKTGGYKHSVRNSVRVSVRKIISLKKNILLYSFEYCNICCLSSTLFIHNCFDSKS